MPLLPRRAAEPHVARDSRVPGRAERQTAERWSARSSSSLRTPAPSPALPTAQADVGEDVQTLAMSTLSFQDYVRERMLKRRQAELNTAEPDPSPATSTLPARTALRLSCPDDVTSACKHGRRRQRAGRQP